MEYKPYVFELAVLLLASSRAPYVLLTPLSARARTPWTLPPPEPANKAPKVQPLVPSPASVATARTPTLLEEEPDTVKSPPKCAELPETPFTVTSIPFALYGAVKMSVVDGSTMVSL